MVKEQKSEERENITACSRCGSTLTYVRIKEHSRVCRSCGFVQDMLEENKKAEEK